MVCALAVTGDPIADVRERFGHRTDAASKSLLAPTHCVDRLLLGPAIAIDQYLNGNLMHIVHAQRVPHTGPGLPMLGGLLVGLRRRLYGVRAPDHRFSHSIIVVRTFSRSPLVTWR